MIQNLLVLLTLHPAARSSLRDAAQQTTSLGCLHDSQVTVEDEYGI